MGINVIFPVKVTWGNRINSLLVTVFSTMRPHSFTYHPLVLVNRLIGNFNLGQLSE